MGNLHVGIVDHDGKIIGGHSVGSENDKVVEKISVKGEGATNEVVEGDRLLRRVAEADDMGNIRGNVTVPASPIVAGREALCLGLLAALLQFVRSAGAAVGMAMV